MRTLERADVFVIASQHVGRRRQQLELLRPQGRCLVGSRQDSKASGQAPLAKASRPRETSLAFGMQLNLTGRLRRRSACNARLSQA